MNRRDFLKIGASGLTMVAVGTMADWPLFSGSPAFAAHLASGYLELDMVADDAEMVDGVLVPMWAFTLTGTDYAGMLGGPRIPGPGLIALEGDRIRMRITNSVGQGGAHGFAIPGVVSPVTIPPGDHVEIEFTAPAAGTYMYLDPLNAPVNRVMGLHGSFIVLPNPIGNNTPYSNPTNRVQQLFNDLGT
ncbi:MAG: multicopper oxidase domain-containing protein, partial [Desulfuromonadales bacterium]|nr:multicopper oxidase domain-containing protein [Desulfuromonadales bacterium]